MYWVITWKLLFGEGDFSGVGNEHFFFAAGRDSSSIYRVSSNLPFTGKFCLKEFWSFNAFVMLQIRFSNPQLIKISMIYLYIKSEVKKNNTAAMTTAINEAVVLVRGIFLVWEMRIFLLLDGILPPSTGFLSNGRLWKGAGQFIHGRGHKQDKRRWHIFGKMGDTGGMIQGDNSAGQSLYWGI